MAAEILPIIKERIQILAASSKQEEYKPPQSEQKKEAPHAWRTE